MWMLTTRGLMNDDPILFAARDRTSILLGGACAVLVDGAVARSCCVTLAAVAGREVTTLEGLAPDGVPGRVQQAFIAEQAAQCGYCLNGMIMAAEALLRRVPAPSDGQIRGSLSRNLCRCGAHVEILRAVHRAAAA